MTELSLHQLLAAVGGRLSDLRRQRRQKIATVAAGVSLSPSLISQVENGRYSALSLQVLHQLASYYQVSLHDLLQPPGRWCTLV